MVRHLKELWWYGCVSLCALAVDALALLALTRTLQVQYLVAATVSFILGALVAYALSVRWVFAFRRIRHRGAELTAFVLLGVVGLIVNAVVIAALVELAAFPVLLAKLGAAGCTFLVNFLLRRRLLFAAPARSPLPGSAK